jgi:hypothetical protein
MIFRIRMMFLLVQRKPTVFIYFVYIYAKLQPVSVKIIKVFTMNAFIQIVIRFWSGIEYLHASWRSGT